MTRTNQLWGKLEEGHAMSRGGQVPGPRGKQVSLVCLRKKKKTGVVKMSVGVCVCAHTCGWGGADKKESGKWQDPGQIPLVAHGEPQWGS